MSRKFIIKEATRKRCRVFQLREIDLNHFRPISLELFHYLWDIPTIDFSIYIRVEEEMIEYIKPSELSEELLQHVWIASLRENAGIEVYIMKKDYPKFEHTLSFVRQKKINLLLDKDPSLDRRTLEVFSDLSGASQMVLRGGVTKTVAERVKTAAAYMVQQLMGNDSAVSTLSRMITIDPTLYDHSASVAMFSTLLAKQHINPQLSLKEAEVIAQCGLYHDAGKSCIPHAILNKPGAFTPEEFEVMKTHVGFGFEELQRAINSGAPIDELAAKVALEHHERFTGKGYPSGKKGRYEDNPREGIHLYARIVAVADTYSALLMRRVYKPALPAETALEFMQAVATEDFDPLIFEPFARGVRESLAKHENHPDHPSKKRSNSQIYVVEKNESLMDKIIEVRKANQALKGDLKKPS